MDRVERVGGVDWVGVGGRGGVGIGRGSSSSSLMGAVLSFLSLRAGSNTSSYSRE